MEFTLKTVFKTSAKRMYNAWLDSDMHTEMTGGEAKASDQIGDEFSAWDGYIGGKNLELTPYHKIAQSWRTTEFSKDDKDSIIEITLTEEGGETELVLYHRDLPAHGEQYKSGWENHYFQPMRAYFEKDT